MSREKIFLRNFRKTGQKGCLQDEYANMQKGTLSV